MSFVKKTEMVRVRVSKEELTAWSTTAARERLTLSDWLRRLAAAALPPKKKK